MTIEILFPKLCNLYGDIKNMDYFRRCLPDAEFVSTEITDAEPYFAAHEVDMVYLGSMSEAVQPRVISWLKPWVSKIREMVEADKLFLVTGNAMEVFTKSIENVTSKTTVEGLGLIPLTTKIDFYDRFNGKNLSELDGFALVGFRSQFSMLYGDNKTPFVTCEKGIGINRETKAEGYRSHNFIATAQIGPLLLLNPLFTEYLMKLMGIEEPKAAFRETAMDAYEQRLSEFRDSKTPFLTQ